MTKKTRKALMMVLCAVALVAISVGATVAYLTSTDTVTNTFTVGNVAITLDEAAVDEYGAPEKDENENLLPRVHANEYRLVPGHLYEKDPTVHVDPNSESCYLFVKVENGIKGALVTDENSIETQIKNNGWTQLSVDDAAVDGVYYRYWNKNNTDGAYGEKQVDYEVFSNFLTKYELLGGSVPTPGPDGEVVADNYLANYEGKTIKVTAYAIQSDGFDNVQFAWEALNNQ